MAGVRFSSALRLRAFFVAGLCSHDFPVLRTTFDSSDQIAVPRRGMRAESKTLLETHRMERDKGQRNIEPFEAVEPRDAAAGEPQPNENIGQQDATTTSEPPTAAGSSATSSMPEHSLENGEVEARQEEVKSEPPPVTAEAALQGDSPTTTPSSYVAPVTPPADVVVPPGPPASAPRRRHSHLLPLTDPGAIAGRTQPGGANLSARVETFVSQCPEPHGQPRSLGATNNVGQPKCGRGW